MSDDPAIPGPHAQTSTFLCPVCGKECADPHVECARCGADLADVIRARNAAHRYTTQGLQAFPHAPDQAGARLQRAYRLRPDKRVAQQIACAYLLGKKYAAAMHWRQIALATR